MAYTEVLLYCRKFQGCVVDGFNCDHSNDVFSLIHSRANAGSPRLLKSSVLYVLLSQYNCVLCDYYSVLDDIVNVLV